jgi:cell division protein FtsA
LAQIINARVEEILEMVNTELKAYGAFEQKKKLIAGIVLTGGGSNLKHLRQLANYTTGFDSRIGFANEYIANDKNQYLKGPEFATSIGLLMESLKIRDKNRLLKNRRSCKRANKPEAAAVHRNCTTCSADLLRFRNNRLQKKAGKQKSGKLTFGQSLMEKVKKFFEEVE